MKVGDGVMLVGSHAGAIGVGVPLDDVSARMAALEGLGLVLGKHSRRGVEYSSWDVLWSGMHVTAHYDFELRVLHESR
jgi:hypothetical protein